MNIILLTPMEMAASKTSKVPRTFRSKKSYEFFSPLVSWIPYQAAMWTIQSQPLTISVNFGRSKIDPWIKTVPFFKFGGARRSRITGYEGLAEISRPSCQKHLHCLSPLVTLLAGHTH